jgi:hypothetical protein
LSGAWEKVPAAILFRLMERADFERREPRCRICRDEAVRILVGITAYWRTRTHKEFEEFKEALRG